MSTRRLDRPNESHPSAEVPQEAREFPRAAAPVGRGRLAVQLARLFARAGVELDGDAPQDIQVRDPRFFPAVAARGSLGLGEGYVEGWWDCERVDELAFRLLRA